jgi:hypothetical protein
MEKASQGQKGEGKLYAVVVEETEQRNLDYCMMIGQDLVKYLDSDVKEIARDVLCASEYEGKKAYMLGNFDDKERQGYYKKRKKVQCLYLGETNRQNWRLRFRHGMVPVRDDVPGVSDQPPQFGRILVLPRSVGHQKQKGQEST